MEQNRLVHARYQGRDHVMEGAPKRGHRRRYTCDLQVVRALCSEGAWQGNRHFAPIANLPPNAGSLYRVAQKHSIKLYSNILPNLKNLCKFFLISFFYIICDEAVLLFLKLKHRRYLQSPGVLQKHVTTSDTNAVALIIILLFTYRYRISAASNNVYMLDSLLKRDLSANVENSRIFFDYSVYSL